MSETLRSAVMLTTSGLVVLSGVIAASQAQPTVEYRIGPGDMLTVSLVGEDPKYSNDVSVRPDGRITLPLVGEITAAGLTLIELKEELTRAYAKYFQAPVVSVNAKQIQTRNVSISGEVVKPGSYRLSDPMNLLQLITLAGGLKPSADVENIILVRRERLPNGKLDVIIFNHKRLFEPGSVVAIPQLRPGDHVFVK